jgi:hypothetical protein
VVMPGVPPQPECSMPADEPTFPLPTLAVRPWDDPVIDQLGYDPRSAYVERFWLAVLGPSTVWLLRRLADQFDQAPAGFTLDLPQTARALGVGSRGGRNSPFMRSIERTCRFGAARFVEPGALAVRRKLAPLSAPQAARLPDHLREEHRAWIEAHPCRTTPEEVRTRARQLALSLLQLGEDVRTTERQLHRWRVHPAVAHEAVRWAVAHHEGPPPPA